MSRKVIWHRYKQSTGKGLPEHPFPAVELKLERIKFNGAFCQASRIFEKIDEKKCMGYRMKIVDLLFCERLRLIGIQLFPADRGRLSISGYKAPVSVSFVGFRKAYGIYEEGHYKLFGPIDGVWAFDLTQPIGSPEEQKFSGGVQCPCRD